MADVYTEHGGLRLFLPGFEALLGGSGPSDEPSFLDRAKQRWSARHSDQQ